MLPLTGLAHCERKEGANGGLPEETRLSGKPAGYCVPRAGRASLCHESGARPGTSLATMPLGTSTGGQSDMFLEVRILMLDREKLEAILRRRFAGANPQQIAAAANAIMGLGEEWEEVVEPDWSPGADHSGECDSLCCLTRESAGIRVLRRRAM